MNNEFLKRVLSSIILIPLVFFVILMGSYYFILFIMLCYLLSFYEWYFLSKEKNYQLPGLIFLVISMITAIYLRLYYSEDYFYFLFIILICVATDIGGYAFGKLFKGPKLTKVSPNKTYSGVIGSYLCSLTVSYFFILYFQNFLIIEINLFLVTVLVSSVSQIGDIILSYFKRLSNLKDTGKLIPGHGGILDRVDGMIFALPFSNLLILI